MIIIKRKTIPLSFTGQGETFNLIQPAVEDRPLFNSMTGEQYTDPLQWQTFNLLRALMPEVETRLIERAANGLWSAHVLFGTSIEVEGDKVSVVLTAMIDDGKEGL